MELKINAKDSLNASFLKLVEFQKSHISEKSIYAELDSIKHRLSSLGYLENKIDSFSKKDSIYTAQLILGDNTELVTIFIKKNNLIHLNSKNLGIDKNKITLLIPDVPAFLNSILFNLEDNGFPFSKVFLKNITKQQQNLIADLQIETFTERTIDKIIVKGYENFPAKYIRHYLNLKAGTKFNSKDLIVSSEAVNSLSFASELKSPEVLFEKDSTTVYLYIDKRKNNSFDGLLGFTTNEEGKLDLNGYLDLQLNNVFNKGESFSINWKGNGNERTSFNIDVTTPFLFNSPISPRGSLNIYKQDSSFINIKGSFDLTYIINPKNSITGLFRSESSTNLLEDIQTGTVEEFKNKFYGLAYTFRKHDDFNPFYNKFYFSSNLLWGNRSITLNTLSESQKRFELETYYNWPLNSKNSIYIKNSSSILISDTYLMNELYRIGGSNSIRGFDEESVFSSTFSVFNLEYRYQLNLTSYLYSITDFAYTENSISKTDARLYGFGIGYSYGTKSGIVDLSYAIGKNNDIPFNFNNSRFHIKYIQLF